MVDFRILGGVKMSKQFGADALESWFKQIQAIAESLITWECRKPVCPVIFNQIVDLKFREFAVEMSEKPDANEFLVGKMRLGIVTQALKTSLEAGIVNLTDKQIKFD
jgi:hypothetical protein